MRLTFTDIHKYSRGPSLPPTLFGVDVYATGRRGWIGKLEKSERRGTWILYPEDRRDDDGGVVFTASLSETKIALRRMAREGRL